MLKAIVSCVCLAFTSAAAGGQSQADPAEVCREITAGLEAVDGFSGQVLIEVRGEVLLRRAFGQAREGLDATSETKYYIGSVAKSMTSTVVLGLCSEGILGLDTSIDVYLPSVPDDKRQVTIRHLLAHSSGLPTNHENPFEPLDREAFETWALAQPLAFEPGSRFQYSNVAYALLAAIVERVTETPFADVVRERLFIPAGMQGAHFLDDPALNPDTLAIGQGPLATQLGLSGNPIEFQPTWLRMGAGHIVCTADDLLAFDHALSEGKVLDPEMLALATTEGPERGWGLGWRLMKTHQGRRILWHNGSFPGFNAEFFRLVDDHVTLVVLCNKESMAERVRNDIASALGRLAQ